MRRLGSTGSAICQYTDARGKLNAVGDILAIRHALAFSHTVTFGLRHSDTVPHDCADDTGFDFSAGLAHSVDSNFHPGTTIAAAGRG